MKVLLIRLSSIGDIVLTTPVIRALKQQLPDCELHFVVKEQFLPVVAANPHIDRIFTIRNIIGEVIPTLKEQNYDHVVDLHRNFRSYGIRMALGKRASAFPKLNFKKWLLVQFKINRLPGIHIVDRYFKAVKPLGVINDGKGLDYFIPEGEEVSLDDLPEHFSEGYTAFVIGAKHATKSLPEEMITEICRMLDSPVVLIGGEEDSVAGSRIAKDSGSKVFNACGVYGINGSADLIRRSRAVISHDTGMMHIASAFRKPLSTIWGNTVPEFGMYPYMPGDEDKFTIREVKGLSCRPCSKIGYDKCPKGHFKCMRDIDVKEVVLDVRR